MLAADNVPGARPDPQHPEQLTAVPFEALKQVNVMASDTQRWSDAYPTPSTAGSYDNNGRPVVPNPLGR